MSFCRAASLAEAQQSMRDAEAVNSAEYEDPEEAVAIATKEIQLNGNTISYSFPANFVHANADTDQIRDHGQRLQSPRLAVTLRILRDRIADFCMTDKRLSDF